MATVRNTVIEKFEGELKRLQSKRSRLTKEIDSEITFYEKMLTTARSRGAQNGSASKGSNSRTIKGTKNPLALFLYDLIGQYEEIAFGEIVMFVHDAKKKLALKYSNGAISGALSSFSCFINVRKGVWKLGRSK